jgi:hypothetical protein
VKRSLIFILIAGISLFILSPTTIVEEKFYYAFDEKVPLAIKANTILVKYVEGTERTSIIETVDRFIKDFTIKWHGPLTVEITVNSNQLADDLANMLKQKD